MGQDTKISWTDNTFNPWIGCTKVSPGCDNCLSPDTPILYADLQWRPIGQAKVGDEILGFDEFAEPGSFRKLRSSVVERVWFSMQPAYNITTAKGTIGTTRDHRWLRKRSRHWFPTYRIGGQSLRNIPVTNEWKITQEYKRGYLSGMTEGDGTFRYVPGQRSDKLGFPQAYWRVALADEQPLGRIAAYLASFGVEANIKPFSGSSEDHLRPMQKVEVRALGRLQTIHEILSNNDESLEFMRGWVAGFFDAEGESSHGVLRVSQATPETLFRFSRYAAKFGFGFDYEPWEGRVDTLRLADTLAEKLRFFSEFQPAISRKWEACAIGRRCATEEVKVLAVEKAPAKREVVDIQTSTRTFWAAGMATHNCYAESLNHRWGHDNWGKGKPRRVTSEANWAKPITWNNRAKAAGTVEKVFCGSLCDVMDDEAPEGVRERLWELIDKTPNLIWQLLTKRPTRYERYLPDAGFKFNNVWLGTTTEDQGFYEVRVKAILDAASELHYRNGMTRGYPLPRPITFVSYEPALGPLSIRDYPGLRPHWIIFGGETGPHPRPMGRAWAENIKSECEEFGVSFWLKQFSARTPEKAADLIPVELLLRQFPEVG